MLTFGSLFSGIGGLDLGLERAGMTCRWQVEIDDYARRVLAKHWPDVPRHGDIRDLTGEELGPVDLICGGFPCQDISSAHTNGERAALDGAKSGLWGDYARLVSALTPRFVLVENVADWRRWVPRVRSDLYGLGYASVPIQLSAGSFGAPHRRPRCFVVAHAYSEGEPLRPLYEEVACLSALPVGSGDWRLPPSRGFRVADGVPATVDRLRGLGNAVVPQVAEWLGRRIAEATS